ncbi:MAG TPA: DNA polymerase III subunit beta [Methylomirabilota bacterium]|jgi:DNA polymerase-3 subunit beta
MDVVLDRDAFLKGLQMVHNIVEPRQTLPILANVLMEADGETVRITATDLEVGARVSIPARVASDGSVTVSARKLTEIVKELPSASLSLKVGENAGVTMRCAGVSYRLVGMAPDDFPAVVPAAPPAWLRMEAGMLREMLSQTSFAISHDESRFALNGVLFVLQAKEVRFVATDGHRLALATRGVGQGLSGVSGIVPRKAVVEIMRVLGASEDVQIAITENQFVMQMPNFVMTARLIEGQFPNWEAVLPKNHPGRLALKRSSLAAALRRVSVMAEERNKPVRFALASGTLTLSAASHDLGEAEEQLEVDYTGGDLTIGFNSRYILDALTPMEHDDVLFEFKDALSPGVLRSAADEGYCCVIMPMRI